MEKTSQYILMIGGIVALVGIVTLFLGKTTTQGEVYVKESTESSDLTGQVACSSDSCFKLVQRRCKLDNTGAERFCNTCCGNTYCVDC